MNIIQNKWNSLKLANLILLCLLCKPSISHSERQNTTSKEDKTAHNFEISNSNELLIFNSNSLINLNIDPQIENMETGIPDDPGNPDAPIDSEILFLIVAGLGLGFYSKTKLKQQIN